MFNKKSSTTPSRNNTKLVSGKTALVAEGGGQRGIFTACVLDTWLDAGYDPR